MCHNPIFVDDVDGSAVIEIDVERCHGRMVVHGDELMRAIVDVHHDDIRVRKDGFVVRRKGCLRCERTGTEQTSDEGF
jgi:hypothetical protein